MPALLAPGPGALETSAKAFAASELVNAGVDATMAARVVEWMVLKINDRFGADGESARGILNEPADVPAAEVKQGDA